MRLVETVRSAADQIGLLFQLQRGPVGLDPFPGPARIVTTPTDMAALGAGVLACLLLLLFLYRRKTYTLYWTCSWTLISASLLLAGRAFGDELTAGLMLGLSHLLSIAASLLMAVSALRFRRAFYLSPKLLFAVLPLVVWFVLAPLALGRRSVFVPGHLVSAVTLGLAGAAFLTLVRQFRMVGATLIGGSLIGLAISNLWIGIHVLGSPLLNEVPIEALTINATLYFLEALGMHLLVAEDMTYELRVANRQLSAAQSELQALAVSDDLTGCYNRRFFHQIIGRELKRHQRYGLPLSLLFIDIDHFKAINDRLGHDTGDQVIQLVADLLLSRVRDVDYVFRWGGDEFVVLLSCNLEHARRKASEIKSECRRLTEQMGALGRITLSIGCGEAAADLEDPFALVQAADDEMYRDKIGSRTLSKV
ncbi:MAG TPA: GGDEF domain-containing protein [Vicinamibacterales bacterium]|jgi:diguanylate cyclase (GGDEF)-like protein